MITEYKVAAAVYIGNVESAVYQVELENKVNALIEDGWQPFGSLQIVERGTSLIALQPMVRLDGSGGVSKSILRQVETGIHG